MSHPSRSTSKPTFVGGLSAALVPRFRSMSTVEGDSLFRSAFVTAILTFSILALIFLVWPGVVFKFLAPGLNDPGSFINANSIVLIALSLPLTAVAGVATAYLNARYQFFIAGCGTLIFNLCALAGLILGPLMENSLFGLCFGIGVGAFARSLSQLVYLPRRLWTFTSIEVGFDCNFLQAFFASSFSASLMLLVPVIMRAMASGFGSGLIASFNYSLKLVELPIGIFLASIATVSLSRFSELEATGDHEGALVAGAYYLKRSLLIALAVMLIGLWFAEPVVRIVLGRGSMDSQAIERITELFQIALLGVPAVSAIGIGTALLNAELRPDKVFICTAICLVLLFPFALPGFLLHSLRLLIFALVGFQIVLATILCRSAGLNQIEMTRWFDYKTKLSLFFFLVIVGVIYYVDIICSSAPLIGSDLTRVFLALSGFLCAITIPAKIYRNA